VKTTDSLQSDFKSTQEYNVFKKTGENSNYEINLMLPDESGREDLFCLQLGFSSPALQVWKDSHPIHDWYEVVHPEKACLVLNTMDRL